jgi:catechol 2,3-dioxygenase-like lactoylglutathione lyase family enzyme
MIADLHHVQLSAPPESEAIARRFYRDLLGLAEIEKPPALKTRGGVWFKAGDRQLHIGVEQGYAPPRKAHPAFSVVGLDALRERLEAAGFKTESDDLFAGYRRLYVRDPFGNRLEFLEPLPSDDS